MRHISFVETGRTKPSPGMVARLIEVLDIPEHEAFYLRRLVGHVAPSLPAMRSDDLGDALRRSLAVHQDAAIAFDHNWDILMVNDAYARFLEGAGVRPVVEPLVLLPAQSLNHLELVLGRNGFRKAFLNWDQIAAQVLSTLRPAIVAGGLDARAQSVVDDLMRDPLVKRAWDKLSDEAIEPIKYQSQIAVGDKIQNITAVVSILGWDERALQAPVRIEVYHSTVPAAKETDKTSATKTPASEEFVQLEEEVELAPVRLK